MKTRQEVEKLKQDWINSNGEFDIVDDAVGFDEYKDELIEFKEKQEQIWHIRYLQSIKNAPAFSSVIEEEYGDMGHKRQTIEGGLTKREYFAAMAMQGLLANVDVVNWNNSQFEEQHFAKIACAISDALISQLYK